MKFGIVLCSRCRTARGVRLNAKTATCPKCGKRMELKKARLLCKVDSEREVASAVSLYNTKLKGGEEIYAQDIRSLEIKPKNSDLAGKRSSSEIYDKVVRKLISIGVKDELPVAAARELCRYLGGFTGDDLNEVLKRVGLDGDEIRRCIAKLIENNVIFEPKSGVYRCLDGE